MEEVIRKGKYRMKRVSLQYMLPYFSIVMGSQALACLGMIIVGYYYIVKRKISLISACLLCISALVIEGYTNAYIVALSFACFYLIMESAKYFHQGLYRYCGITLALMTVFYQLYVGTSINRALFYAFGILLLFEEQSNQFTFNIPKAIWNIYLLAFAHGIALLFPEYAIGIYASLGVLLCMGTTVSITMITLLLLYGINPSLPDYYYLFIFICSHFQNQCFLLFVITIVGSLMMSSKLFLAIGLSFLIAGVYARRLPKQEVLPVLSDSQKEFKKRLRNFSVIFETLSVYYEAISPIQAEMLKNMADALTYSADTLHSYIRKEETKEKIEQALEAYQYEIEQYTYDQNEEGIVSVDLTLRNIQASEYEETVLPLLENLCEVKLSLSRVKNRRFLRGWCEAHFESIQPLLLDAYADSFKNRSHQCGDSFSIFSYRQFRICMISDGMGSGKRASEVSRSMTTIFQRMISSDIPMEISVRCMNKLIQSDVFATMDVIAFDLNQKLAYLFKSAACPTFLLRSGELYEISGSNLPMGILNTLDADCYTLKLKENDAFLMFSDGVYLSEVYEWLKKPCHQSAKEQVQNMMDILARTKRKDDSTVLYAKVLKNNS